MLFPRSKSAEWRLVLDDQRPVAVELQLVDPVVALGELLHDLRGHGRDERRRFPRRVGARAARTGRFLFFFLVGIVECAESVRRIDFSFQHLESGVPCKRHGEQRVADQCPAV